MKTIREFADKWGAKEIGTAPNGKKYLRMCEIQLEDCMHDHTSTVAVQLEQEIVRYRKVLENILDGNYPHAKKLTKCIHGQYWYEPCEQCIEDYITSELQSPHSACQDHKQDEQG